MKLSTVTKKEVLYSGSLEYLHNKLNGRIAIGYKQVGGIVMNANGQWSCLIEKVIDFSGNK